MLPPHQSFNTKLQGRKVGLALLKARQDKHRKLGIYGFDPCISFKGLLCLSKCWGLHPKKLGVCGDRMRSIMISPMSRSLLQLLSHLLLRL
jgi:hypothetical protein